VPFELVSPITEILTIAAGRGIRDLARLRRRHGPGRWRKCKGVALVRLSSGRVRRAELHWYEAHGVGRVNMKVSGFSTDATGTAKEAVSPLRSQPWV
jgi:hypothetical protein